MARQACLIVTCLDLRLPESSRAPSGYTHSEQIPHREREMVS